jgi:heme-degrading monooxygenase HmoA
MIVRVWHGWTVAENAERYETLLKTEIFKGIAAKSIPGYRKMELVRRDLKNEVEFMTIMHFDSIDDVRQLAGPDYEQAHVPAAARALLARFDARAQHYELRETLDYAAEVA